ncbi:MAG TPA: hypothetical protein PKC30_14175 [Saprospiraceae bacterium]|mgnify:FL=1|nr:hypothetical protein [Saprospiraceae bacterium]
MKKMKYISGLIVGVMILVTSCTDFIEPNIPYTDFDTGAYLRTIERTSVDFNFFDLANSRFAVILEAVDIEDGNTVESVEVRVRHRRLIPGVGLQFTPSQDVLVSTLTRADFQTNSQSRFLRAPLNVTASAAISAVGLTAAQIEGGDVFEFRLVLRTTTGRVFTDNNRSADVGGGIFYSSPFLYNVAVICPLTAGYALGPYTLVQTTVAPDPFFGNATRFVEGTVTLTQGGSGTERVFTVGYLGGFTVRPFTIDFSCGLIIKPAESAGAGCTAGNPITWQSSNDNLSTYNPQSDAVITINFIDDATASCAALANTPMVLTLTKQ